MIKRISIIFLLWMSFTLQSSQAKELLNSSYDIARELFAELNLMFIAQWQQQTSEKISIKQSHAGSSKQALSILQGMPADIVTYNQVTDVSVLYERGNLIPGDWQARFPNNSSPYYSTMAFLVRKGNPKGINDWQDLVRTDIKIVFPNPKTSGNGRYTYLAIWNAFNFVETTSDNSVKQQVAQVLKNVVVSDIGGRGATTSFIERGLGDVLITFESEVNNIRKQYGVDNYVVIVPQINVLAEFPVTWVDKVTQQKQTTELAKAYLTYLYSTQAQQVMARHAYRVHDESVMEQFTAQFPAVELHQVERQFGSWSAIMQTHFANGGVYDQLLAAGR